MLAIEILMKGTVLLALAWGLAAALRGASAATRHLVWSFALVGIVGMPLLTAVSPWRLEVLPTLVRFGPPPAVETLERAEGPAPGRPVGEAPSVKSGGSAETAAPDAVRSAGDAPAAGGISGDDPVEAAASPVRPSWALLLGLWAAGAALVSARWLAGALALRRCVKAARPIGGPEWDEPLWRASDRLLLDTPVRLLVSDSVPMPLTAGVFRPVVILPETALEWSDERRSAVIVHELAHVRRKDALAHTLAWGACALWWFHPMVWAAARRLRAESERACDDLVLRAGTRASSYADHLLDIVCHAPSPRAPAPAMPLAQRSEFEGRMLRILSPDARRHGLSALKALAVAAVFATVAVPLAAIGPAPPRADSARTDGDRSAVRRVVDALLPEESARFVARSLLREEPRDDVEDADGSFSKSESVTDSNSDSNSNSDSDSISSSDSDSDKGAGMSSRERATAVAALIPTLRDGNADVRQAAARGLGELEDPRAVAALMRALRTDPDAGVRQMAAWALGEIEDARAVPALGEAVRGDADAGVREMAVWALGEIESPGAIEYLRTAMRDSSPKVRTKAVWALGEIEDPGAVPALTEALRDDNAEIRRTAAWALGEIESPSAVEPLGGALRDSDVEVRRKAAWALGEIEDPRALPALSAALGDADAEVRSTAAWAIGEIQPASAPAALIEAAGDSSAKVREYVAWALGEIEDPAGVPALRRLIQDSNAEVRKDAIWALTEIHAPSAYEALVELLNDEDPEVRKAAARALGDADWDR
ncbi:MAG TPA: HEAT repeat domain-containing protein [Gemmatimonadota bacterium]|nr:HEAT repeat domain-containing protein [Gemmatimonadota bacterium]